LVWSARPGRSIVVAEPAQHALAAEPVDQRLDVADAVLQRQREAAGLQAGADDAGRLRSAVGVDLDQRRVELADLGPVRRRLGRPHPDLPGDPAELQPVAPDRLDVLAPAVVEHHFPARTGQQSAIEAAHRARPDHADPHRPPSSRPCACAES
jgi:hypothetical protein